MTEMPKEILKPCPFCRADNNLYPIVISKSESCFYEDRFEGGCTNCGARSQPCDTEQEAIILWNTRSDQVPAQDVREAVATCQRYTDNRHAFFVSAFSEMNLVSAIKTLIRAATQPKPEVVTIQGLNSEWVKTGLITVGQFLAKRFPNGLKVEG